MNYTYYTKQKLKELEDHSLSFGICNNLLDSAFHILQNPFELLRNEQRCTCRKYIEKYDLISSFQSIVTAIELLMKSMIAAKGWEHLFSKKTQISREALISGDFHSINFDKSISVIENLYKIKIDDRIKSRIEEIRVIRNKLAHYYLDFSKNETLNYIAFGLDIYIDFYRSYAKDIAFDSCDRTEGFEEDLSDIHQFVTVRIESVHANLGSVNQLNKDLNSECQKCWTENLIVIKSKEIKCLYCGNQPDIEEFAAYHADDDSEIAICQSCEKHTVIIQNNSNPNCVICGKS